MSQRPPHIRSCARCHKPETGLNQPLRECIKCNKIFYCSRTCQRSDWKRHKKDCEAENSKTSAKPKSNVLAFPGALESEEDYSDMPPLVDDIESLNISHRSQRSRARYNAWMGIGDDYSDMPELVDGNESLNPAIQGQHNHPMMNGFLNVHRSSQHTSGRVIELDGNESFHPSTQSQHSRSLMSGVLTTHPSSPNQQDRIPTNGFLAVGPSSQTSTAQGTCPSQRASAQHEPARQEINHTATVPRVVVLPEYSSSNPVRAKTMNLEDFSDITCLHARSLAIQAERARLGLPPADSLTNSITAADPQACPNEEKRADTTNDLNDGKLAPGCFLTNDRHSPYYAPSGKILDNGTLDWNYLGNCSELEAYHMLIDIFRLRHIHGKAPPFYDNFQFWTLPNLVSAFSHFLDLAETAKLIFPEWWNSEKRMLCMITAQCPAYWSYLGKPLREEDVTEHYLGDIDVVRRMKRYGYMVYWNHDMENHCEEETVGDDLLKLFEHKQNSRF